MPVAYTNCKGKTYYLCQTVTKKGEPWYFFASEPKGEPVEQVPEGLKPLPLDVKMDPKSIPRLSRIISLGFPLGSSVQEASVNVSVSSGHVRRQQTRHWSGRTSS